jgi:Putative lumazine-binding
MDEGERAGIEAVVTDYLEGMIWNDPERLRRAMHPLCMQSGHYKGQFEFCDRDAFIESLESEKTVEPGTPFEAAIVPIDMTGDVAVVKVTSECLGTSFTDYLMLIKLGNRWRIVMKAFFDHANETNG